MHIVLYSSIQNTVVPIEFYNDFNKLKGHSCWGLIDKVCPNLQIVN